jgi:hypothetical protein
MILCWTGSRFGAIARRVGKRIGLRRSANRMRAELAEAVAAIEEVNRIKGFAAALAHSAATGTPFDQILRCPRTEVERSRIPNDGYLGYFHSPPTPTS